MPTLPLAFKTAAARLTRTRVLRGCVLIWLSAAVLGFSPLPGLGALDRLEAIAHDARTRLLASAMPDARVSVLEIDDAALAALGRWPWSRAQLAELVERLFAAHRPAALGLDLLLSEPESEQADGALAASLRGRPVVLGFDQSALRPATQALVVPQLAEQAAGLGYLNGAPSTDGVRRFVSLLAPTEAGLKPAFALEVVRVAHGASAWRLHSSEPGGRRVEWLPAEQRAAQRLGRLDEVALPFVSSASVQRLSVTALMAGQLPRGQLDGQVLLLGATAAGLGDRHRAAAGSDLPGVWLHAGLVARLLDGKASHVPAWAPLVGLAALLAVHGTWPALVALAALRRRPEAASPAVHTAWGLGLPLVLGLVWLAATVLAQAWWAIALPMLPPLIMGLAGLLLGLVSRWREQSREKQRLHSVLARYVPPQWSHRLAQPQSAGGESRDITVLFADLRGFSALAESLPAADLAQLLKTYFSALTDVVRQHGGTLDKYVGDALMAFWGAPEDDADHALHAVQAAVAIQRQMPTLNQHMRTQGWPGLKVGMGIQSGRVIVGELGSQQRAAYTAIGDAVNVAARLEGLSSRMDKPILLGDDTARRLPRNSCLLLGPQQLHGRRQPVTVWEPNAAFASPFALTAQSPHNIPRLGLPGLAAPELVAQTGSTPNATGQRRAQWLRKDPG